MKGIGSLSWFAGVWWLAVAGVTHWLAQRLLNSRIWRIPGGTRLTWGFALLSAKASWLAHQCAAEAGMGVE